MTAARALLAVLPLALLPACLDVSGSTGFKCYTKAPETLETRGDTTVTNVGLRFIETTVGTGTLAPVCRGVTIHFRASVLNGAAFDSTYGGLPITFVTGGGQLRVAGVDVGVVGMKTGGKRRLIVPPQLGYGEVAQVNNAGEVVVPASSTLVYDVELVSVDTNTP